MPSRGRGKQLLRRIQGNDPTYTDTGSDLCSVPLDGDLMECLADGLRNHNTALNSLTLLGNDFPEADGELLANALRDGNTPLTTLSIRCNSISDTAANSLADALRARSETLTTLELTENGLSDAAAESLANALCDGNTELTTLELEENGFTDAGAKSLAKALRHGNMVLDTLKLNGNEIGDAGAEALANALRDGNTTLTNLELKANKIGDVGATALANALCDGKAKVTNLVLTKNDIGDAGATAFGNALSTGNVALKMLLLGDNEINDAGFKGLAAGLWNGNTELSTLDLHRCMFAQFQGLRSNNISDEGVKSLTSALCNGNAKLTMLNLNDNQLGDAGANCLAEALRHENSTLKELILDATKIGDTGATALAGALYDNTTLQVLHLRRNKFGGDGAFALANSLRESSAPLRELDFSFNKMGNAGGDALACAFRDCVIPLETLRLCNCQMSDEGAKAIADALLNGNTTLKELNLGQNKIGDAGAKSLAAALEHGTTTLRTLDLYKTDIGEAGGNAFAMALLNNVTLMELFLHENDFGDAAAESFIRALESGKCRLTNLLLPEYSNWERLNRLLDYNKTHYGHWEKQRGALFSGSANIQTQEKGAACENEATGDGALHSFEAIDCGELKILRQQLGYGGFSAVYEGIWKEMKVAVKVLNLSGKHDAETILKEKFRHPNVVDIYGCCVDPKRGTHNFVMEYMPKWSLDDVMRQEKQLRWSTKERIVLEIAQGLNYIHSHNKAHGNLKGRNVLLNDNYHAKLCAIDITTSQEKHSIERSANSCAGTPLKEMQTFDIYATGVILWELCTGMSPKADFNSHLLQEFPDQGHPLHVVKLVQDCCHEDLWKRPSAQEVAERLFQAPCNILQSIFPKGISDSNLKQHKVGNCRWLASLHSLKKNSVATSLFKELITDRSRLEKKQNVCTPDGSCGRSSAEQEQDVCFNGWRVYFAPPFGTLPVDVSEDDLKDRPFFNENDEEFDLNVLSAGQKGDRILLVAASRWRRQNGFTDSVMRKVNTFVQGQHGHDSLEFLRLCLYDRVVKEYDVVSNASTQPMAALDEEHAYDVLNQFSEQPHLFVLIAGTTDEPEGELSWKEQARSQMNSWEEENLEFLCTLHMYSVLRADSTEKKVLLANPHNTETETFTLTYDTFLKCFRRLTGVRLSTAAISQFSSSVEVYESGD